MEGIAYQISSKDLEGKGMIVSFSGTHHTRALTLTTCTRVTYSYKLTCVLE